MKCGICKTTLARILNDERIKGHYRKIHKQIRCSYDINHAFPAHNDCVSSSGWDVCQRLRPMRLELLAFGVTTGRCVSLVLNFMKSIGIDQQCITVINRQLLKTSCNCTEKLQVIRLKEEEHFQEMLLHQASLTTRFLSAALCGGLQI